MSEQPYMNFEIRERVKHAMDGKSFNALSSIELEPIIKVYEKEQQIEVAGYLVLNGEFQKDQEDWEEQFEQADGLHHGDFFDSEEYETFQHQIPISFDIQRERVKDTADVFVSIEEFDYDILSDGEMELIANIKLIGVHPNVLQDKPVDLKYSENVETKFPEDFTFSSEGIIQEKHDEENDEKELEEETTSTFSFTNEQSQEEEETVNETSSLEEVSLKDDEREETKEEDNLVETEDTVTEPEAEAEDVMEKDSSQGTANVKIGIKGQSKERPAKEESTSNPLYSLLYRGKKENETEVDQEEVENQKIAKDNQEESLADSNNENQSVISMEDYLKGKESTEDEVSIEEEEESSAKANTTTSQTKDMLLTLLKSNDESNKYKLKMYFVQKNESLEEIAERYDVKVSDLVQYNKLADQSLEEGQILYLPREG